MDRRRALQLLGGGALLLTGCGSDTRKQEPAASGGTRSTSSSAATTTAGAQADGCTPTAKETAGPFPADGSNGPDVLRQSGIVRKDITTSFGAASGVAKGVPITSDLTIVDATNGCAPLAGAAVYLWHCDIDGRYSVYDKDLTGETYLRGVQVADAQGRLSFTSVFPGAYPGRWPHMHFEVFGTLADATSGGRKRATSQLALPEETCRLVYATEGYAQSARTFAAMSLERDSVFSDGAASQLATMTGNVAGGLVAGLRIAV